MQTIQCPSCGGPAEIAGPYIVQTTCGYCETVFIIDEEGAKDTGKKSTLVPSRAGFDVGLRGSWKGEGFMVRGRVQYSWQRGQDSGSWDEWFLELDSGKQAWFSEDMGRFRFEKRAEKPGVTPEKLPVGATLRVGEVSYRIMETGTAKCEGVKGQLPFRVDPEESYPFADGQDTTGEKSITVEFDDEKASIFIGSPIEMSELDYQPIGDENRSVSASSKSDLKCESCGAPLDPGETGEDANTIVCAYCGAINSVDSGIAAAVGNVDLEDRKFFFLELGQKGLIDGIEYTVTGRQIMDWESMDLNYDPNSDNDEDDEYVSYTLKEKADLLHDPEYTDTGMTVEYFLYNKEKGDIYISHEKDPGVRWGHVQVIRPSRAIPEQSLHEMIDQSIPSVSVSDTNYSFNEIGYEKARYIDGAFPWRASINEPLSYVVADGYNATAESLEDFMEERTGEGDSAEIEYYTSRRMDTMDFLKAFGYDEIVQRFQTTPMEKITRNFLLIGGAAITAFMFFSSAFTGAFSSAFSSQRVDLEEFSANTLIKNELRTSSFSVEKGQTIGIAMDRSSQNRDIMLGVALVKDEGDKVMAAQVLKLPEGEGEVKLQAWRIVEPGNYKVLLSVDDVNETYTSLSAKIKPVVYKGVMVFNFWWTFIFIIVGLFLGYFLFGTASRGDVSSLRKIKEKLAKKEEVED